MIKITTWNVNSIRKRQNLIEKFIKINSPDILCLQETKVSDKLFPESFFYSLGYKYLFWAGEDTGYNGVAIASKYKINQLESFVFVENSRHIAIQIEDIALHNIYIPAGGDIPNPEENPKFKYKLAVLDNLAHWAESIQKSNTIILGDFNVAPMPNDVWSHKQLLDVVSHTPVEVEKLNIFMANGGFIDTSRMFTCPEKKLYSWWSYRSKNWKLSDRGRRLDHIWVTHPLKDKLIASYINKDFRDMDTPSDHAPVNIEIKL